MEATGRYSPVAALGEEGNAVLRRALADGWPSAEELARQLAAFVGDAGPRAPVSEGDAAGGDREALPQVVPADALMKLPLRENRAPRRALALGLVVLVGLGGHALHRTHRRPRLPATGEPARWTPPPGPSSPAPAAAGAAMRAWDTVPPAAGGDPQPAPSPGEADGVAAEQPAPSPVQAAPPAPSGPAALAPSAALATRDRTLPPGAAASPSPSTAETPVETTPVPEGGTDATLRAVVLPAPPASDPPALDDAAALEQDGGTATPGKVPADGSERLQGAPGAVRAQQDDQPAAFTPAALRPKTRGRHDHGPRPQPQPTFWQRLFGHKEPKKAKPGKPRP